MSVELIQIDTVLIDTQLTMLVYVFGDNERLRPQN